MSSVRVAYLLKRFPRLSESFVLNEILELKRQGLDLILFAIMDPGEAVVSRAAAELRPEVRYIHDRDRATTSWGRLLAGALRQVGRRPLGGLRVLWALVSVHRSAPSLRHAIEGLWLARELRLLGVTHLHAHFAHGPAAVAYLTWLGGGPPFSFTAHAKDLYTTLPRNVRIRARAARFVVTCTDFNRRHLEEMLGDVPHPPIHVVYHGIHLSRFTGGARHPQPGRIVSVGRLVEKKGYDCLIDALSLLRDRSCEFNCAIYGGGPLREQLTGQIAALGLQDRVKLHGARAQEEIIDAYQTASVFAIASQVMDDGDRDGIPNVLVEAMACQLPAVATRISGIPELVDDGTDGILVPPRDPVALASSIHGILRDPAQAVRMGKAARRKVERSFDISASTATLRALFESPQQGVTGARAA